MRYLAALFAVLFLCVSLAACDSADPAEPLAPLHGAYIGEWQSTAPDALHILSVILDEVQAGDFEGEALMFSRRGPISGGAVRLPLRGNRSGERLRFEIPMTSPYHLEFVGLGRDSILTGTIRGVVWPVPLSGAETDEVVDTQITLVRDGVLTP